MKNYTRSGSSLFLLELLLNLMLFTVLLVVGLGFFIKAHTITANTNSLYRAVTECNNIASLYEAGDGSLSSIKEFYNEAAISQNKAVIYFDKAFNVCSKTESYYKLDVEVTNCDFALKKADLSFSSEKDTLYTTTVCNYSRLSPSSKEVAK